MPTTKKVSLNKAAIMMKRTKAKQNENMLFVDSLIYPIDAISGKQPDELRKQILGKIKDRKKMILEIKDAILLYSNIKQSIVDANVRSGLHAILCQLDMMKDMKKFLEDFLRYDAPTVVQSFAKNLRAQGTALLSEIVLEDPFAFSEFTQQIVDDITRQDSKNSCIQAVIDVTEHSSADIKDALNQITKDMNVLEDKKYEINNTYKIDILIPDSLCEFFGF